MRSIFNAIRTFVVLATMTQASAALADTPADALNAARERGFGNAKFAFGIDVASVRGMLTFKRLAAEWFRRDGTSHTLFERAKSACGIDLFQSVESVVLIGGDASPAPKAMFYVSIKGLSPDNVTDCLRRVSAPGGIATSRPDADGIIELRTKEGSQFVALLPRGVIAFAGNGSDKAMLKRALARRAFAPTDLSNSIAKIDTRASLWGARAEPDRLDEGVTMKVGYGSAHCSLRNCETTLTIEADSEKGVAALTSQLTKNVAELLKGANIPPALVRVARAASFASKGAEFQFKATTTDAELLLLMEFVFGVK